jgi:hypothetical protein
MPHDSRRDQLRWRNKKANHGIKPAAGRRPSDFRFGNRKPKKK